MSIIARVYRGANIAKGLFGHNYRALRSETIPKRPEWLGITIPFSFLLIPDELSCIIDETSDEKYF